MDEGVLTRQSQRDVHVVLIEPGLKPCDVEIYFCICSVLTRDVTGSQKRQGNHVRHILIF